MKSSHWTIFAALALAVPAYCGVMLSGVPTLICPFPMLTVIPAFVFANSRMEWVALLVPGILFIAWNPALLRDRVDVPKRSLALLTLLSALSVLYFLATWEDGMKYQGAQFTYGVCAANTGWLLLLWLVFVRGWRKPSFINNLLAHSLLFAWLGWYAFPYLGELP